MFGRNLILFFVILGIHIILLILHLYSKGDIIGEIFDLEIKLNKYRRPIPWEEITKWRYVPPLFPGKLVTLEGKCIAGERAKSVLCPKISRFNYYFKASYRYFG
jgi:hypothetical protein